MCSVHIWYRVCVSVLCFLVVLLVGTAAQLWQVQASYWFLGSVWEADLIHLRFFFWGFVNFYQNIEGFYFKISKEDYEMADSVPKINSHTVGCCFRCRVSNKRFSGPSLPSFGCLWRFYMGFLAVVLKGQFLAGLLVECMCWTWLGFSLLFRISRLSCSVCMRSSVYLEICRPSYHILLLPHNSSFWLSLMEPSVFANIWITYVESHSDIFADYIISAHFDNFK